MTRLLSTRFGALAVAALLAVAAVGIVLVYAHKYRSSVDNANGEVSVLVANRAISQYTPGSQVVDGSMFSTRQVPADAAVDGAVSNPDQLKGLVARSDIYPGEQLTTNQFVKSNTTSPTVKLTPDQRAVAFPVDAASGLVGQVQAGDHVDVVATFDVTPIGANGLPLSGAQPIALTKTIVSDALVLDAPPAPSSTDTGHSDPVLTLAIRRERRAAGAVRPGEGHHLVRAAAAGLGRERQAHRARRRCRASRQRLRPRPGAPPDGSGTVTNTRLSIAAHREFPGQLLDGAMPNGDSGLLVASGMSDFGRALMAADRDNSQALLMFTPTVGDVEELLASSHQTRPEMALIVALPGPGNGSIGAALKAGAHEIVLLPAESTVVTAAVHKALARVTQAAETPASTVDQAPLVVVLGPKGGVGKTTVATNLAVDLAGRGHSTLLIDLDLQFGDVGIAMGVEPERTIWDLVSAPGHLDGERLRAFLGESADGVHVLLAPVRPDQAESVTPELLDEVLQVARSEFDVVIADTPPAFTPTSILAIDRADQTIMVGTLDLSGTKNMKIGLETLELMGRPRDRVLVVLNRADSKVGLTHADVKGVLSRAHDVALPSDRWLPRSLNAARPIIASEPKSAPAKSLRDLGDRVVAAVLQPKDA